MGLLDGGIERIFAGALSGIYLNGQIITPGEKTGPDYDPTFGDPAPHNCKVQINEFKTEDINGASIQTGDKQVLILKATLAIKPTTEHQFAFNNDEDEYEIIGVKLDGAASHWILQVRR